MTQLLNVDEARRDEILIDAADRLVQVTISRRVDDGWGTYKSVLLQADSQGRCLVIQQPLPAEGHPPPELVAGEIVGLSFRRGHKKCMCSVEITRLLAYPLDGESLPAFEVLWPDKLQEMQRRVYYRADVPKGRRIEVNVWDGGTRGRQAAQLRDVPNHVGLLQDLSAGGCSVLFNAARDPQLEDGDTVGLQFQPDPRSAPILMDAVFRHAEHISNEQIALGFQFVGLEMTPEGRSLLQSLSRIVSTFLRIEIRRKNRRLQNHPRRRK